MRMLLAPLALCAMGIGTAGAQVSPLVAMGRPIAVAFDGAAPARWHGEASGFVGAGEHNLLLARRVPVGDQFAIEIRMQVLGARGHGAAILLGEHWFTLADKDDRLAVEGPGVARRTLDVAAPSPDRRIEIRIEAARGELRWSIDGRSVFAEPLDSAWKFDRVALLPRRATLSVEHFAIEGDSTLLSPRVFPPPVGSSIPQLDLNSESARQVVVDREGGQYLGHPTTVLLEDDRTMIAVYPKGHGKGAIVMKRSVDGGRTWSERLPVPASWSTSLEVPTIHRTIDRQGVRRLIVFSGLRPIRRAVSVDDGASWSELEPIGEFGGIVAMASVTPVAGGDYLAWFHDDGRYIRDGSRQESPPRFTLWQVRSRDGGVTWGAPSAIWSGTREHLCEPGVVRSPDGATLALLLRENSRRFNAQVVFSHDEGVSWSAPVPLCGALTGDRHVARYAPDGRLVVTFRDTGLTSPTQGDWVLWVGRFDDLLEGTEGSFRARLMDNLHAWDCAYPGLELLPDGTFVTTTYGHWIEGEQPFVVSVRFGMSELDARLAR